MSLIKLFFNYWKSIINGFLILFLSFAAPSTFSEIPPFEFTYPDKIVHIIMYGALTMALLLDFKKNNNLNSKKLNFVLFCILFPIIYGGVIEIVQSAYFPPRTGDWFDWIADIIGVMMALMMMNAWEKIIIRRKKS